MYIFICALSLQLYRCGLRLEEISDQLGSATLTNRVPNHEGRRNSYSELLNRLSNIPVLCLCRVSLLSWSNFVSGSVVFTYMYKTIVDITFLRQHYYLLTSPRISNPMDNNNFSVPCPEIMGNHW